MVIDVKRQSGIMISKQNQGDLCEFAFPCLCLQLGPVQKRFVSAKLMNRMLPLFTYAVDELPEIRLQV